MEECTGYSANGAGETDIEFKTRLPELKNLKRRTQAISMNEQDVLIVLNERARLTHQY